MAVGAGGGENEVLTWTLKDLLGKQPWSLILKSLVITRAPAAEG